MIDAFVIWHKPNGKFELQQGKATIDFATHKEAIAGMMRIVKPVIFKYDSDGKPIP